MFFDFFTDYVLNSLRLLKLNGRTNNRDLTQQDGWKTQDGRMTKKRGARLCIPGLARHFFSSFCRPESSSRPVA